LVSEEINAEDGKYDTLELVDAIVEENVRRDALESERWPPIYVAAHALKFKSGEWKERRMSRPFGGEVGYTGRGLTDCS